MLADTQEHSIDYPPVLSQVQHNKPVMVVVVVVMVLDNDNCSLLTSTSIALVYYLSRAGIIIKKTTN